MKRLPPPDTLEGKLDRLRRINQWRRRQHELRKRFYDWQDQGKQAKFERVYKRIERLIRRLDWREKSPRRMGLYYHAKVKKS